MAVIYDHAMTDARRRLLSHQPVHERQAVLCTAGCPQWPCESYSTAWAVVTRNSSRRAGR